MRTPSFYIKVLVLFVSIIAPVVFAQAVFFDETPQTTVEQAQDFLRNLTYDFSDELRGGVEHLVNTGRLVVRESGDAYVESARFAVLLFSDIGGRVGAGGSAAIASTLYGVESVARVDALRDAANVVTNIGPILVRVSDAFVAAGVGVGDRMLVGIADVVHVFAETNRLVGDAAYEFGEHVGAGFIALGEYPHHIYAAVSRVGSHHAIATTRESLRDRGVRGSHIARGVAIDAPAVVATVGGAVDDTGWRSVWNDVRETIVGLFGNSTFPPYVFNRQENVLPVVTEQQIDDASDFAEQSQEEPTAPITTIVERVEYISEPSVVYQTNNTLSSGVSAYELAAAIAGLRAELVPQIELAMRRPRTESHSSGGGGGGGDLDEDELTEYLDDYLPLVGGTLTGDLAGTNVALSGSLTAASLAVTGTMTLSGVAYDFPDADGINGQLLTTDGAGGLSWTTVASGVGTTTWGTIIGTLADQTDLQDALDAKLSTTTADATYTPNTRTLEVAGTADQITSSAGAQDLSGNRTWTLSLPSFVSFPGAYFADAGTTTNATSTNFAVTNSFNFLGTIITDVAAWFSGLFDSNFATKDTDDLTEGAGNFYYTTGRFATDLAGTTTDALDEGLSNLYYTDARVGAYITGSTTLASSINYWTENSGNVYRSSGNVGIGTNSPTATLDLTSSGGLSFGSMGGIRRNGNNIEVGAGTGTSGGSVRTVLYGNGFNFFTVDNGSVYTNNNAIMGVGDETPDAHLEVSANGTTGGNVFLVSSNDANDGDLFTIREDGNVGIGSTTPSARLAVVGASGGTAEAPAALVVVGGTGGTDTSSPPNNAGFDGGLISFLTGAGGFAEGNTQGGDGGVFRITTGNGGDGDFTGTGGNGGDIIFSLGSGGAGAVAGRDGYLILAPDAGLVGIGTTTPSQKLTVDGNFYVTGALYDSTNSAGVSGHVLQSTGTGLAWVATSTLGFSGGDGLFTDDGALLRTTGGEGIQVSHIVSTSTATSTFAGDILMSGHIIPGADSLWDLGTPTRQWRDVYISEGSLYIDGQKVLQSDNSMIVVSADTNQSLALRTSGSGDIELNATGAGLIALKSNIQITGGKTITTSDNSALLFSDGIRSGNINIAGNTISSANTNGDIELDPNGVGNTYVSSGSFGIGTTTPGHALVVAGDAYVTGALRDSTNSAGTDGYVLQSTGTGFAWVATSTLGFSGGGSSSGSSGALQLSDGASGFTHDNALSWVSGTFSVASNLSVTSSQVAVAGNVSTSTAVADALLAVNPASVPTTPLAWATNGDWDMITSANGNRLSQAVDIDGNGTLDYYVGGNDGNYYFQKNTGTATLPQYTYTPSLNITASSKGANACGAFADLDGDGDYDLMSGHTGGVVYGFQNTGTAVSPSFSAHATWDAPDSGSNVCPDLVDLDGDGDYDLLVGESGGITYAYENTGDASSAAWTAQPAWDLPDVGSSAQPRSGDLDGDGDYDLLIGHSVGDADAYENTGTVASPTWTANTDWDTPDLGSSAQGIVLGDLDLDGDLDAVFSSNVGAGVIYENTGSLGESVLFGVAVNDVSKFQVSGVEISGSLPTVLNINSVFDALTIEQGGTGDALVIQSGAFVVTSDGNVGIGDSSPAAMLTVGASDAFQVNSSGRVLANVGASGAGNLGYSFVGDTDTGLYRSATDEVRFQTAGSDRVTINSSGRVGINTASPTTFLEINTGATSGGLNIYGSNIPVFQLGADATNNIQTYWAGGAGILGTYGNFSEIQFKGSTVGFFSGYSSGNQRRMTLDTSGRIGIGTQSPTSILHINGGTGTLNTGLSFGDGVVSSVDGTGFYEVSDDVLRITNSGTDGYRMEFNSNRILSRYASGEGFAIYTDQGSATNPIYSFNGDTNTGIYSSAADTLKFVTAGSDRVTIDSSGRVGIGTASPSTNLDISGTNLELLRVKRTVDDGAAYIKLENGDSNYWNLGSMGAAASNPGGLSFMYNTTTSANALFALTSSGSVGIGTTDPASILHIKSDPASDPADVVFTIQNNDGDLGQTAGIEFVNSTIDDAIGASISAIRSDAVSVADNDLAFSVRSSGTLTEFMRIVGDGNIGIGTSTPAFTLTVDGTVGFDGLTALVSSGDALCLTATNEVGVNTGAQTCTVSSIRFKHGEEDLESGLESVRALRARSFMYNGTEEERVGLIAEEVELVDSRLIFYEPDGTTPRGVRYEDVVALLVKAIQELDEKVELLLANAQTGISNFFEVIAERITTKQLCLEDVCITKTQLEQLLEANNIDPVVNEPADHSEDSEDLSGAEDGVITDETDSLSETNDEGLDGTVGDGGDEALDDAQDVDDGLEGGDANNGDDVEGALPGEDAQEGADTIESDLGEASANDSESSDDVSGSSDGNPSGDADTSSVDGDESTSDDSQSGTDGGESDGGSSDAGSDAPADDSSSE